MKVQSIALYQPDELLAARLPGGVEALSEFIRGLEDRLTQQYLESPVGPTARALVVALTAQHHGYWLLASTGTAPESPRVRLILDTVPRPTVVGGPVAFVLLLNLGEDFPISTGLPIPREWTEVVRAAGVALEMDEILTRMLG